MTKITIPPQRKQPVLKAFWLGVAVGAVTATMTLWAGFAYAGDSVMAGPVEVLMPTVIEVEDYGPLAGFGNLSDWWAGRGVSQPMLTSYLDEDQPLTPAPVPLPSAGAMLALALGSLLIVMRRISARPRVLAAGAPDTGGNRIKL